jgi:hypothetical protein
MELRNWKYRSNLLKKEWNLYDKLALFHKRFDCVGYVQRYLHFCLTAHLLNLFIKVFLTHVLVHLRIFVQADSVACMIDMCRVKDPDRALISQFYTVHELHPTYKYRTKEMY